jgi:hypothetical protein
LSGDIAPWGTVLRSTPTYNFDIIDELSADEKATIANATLPLATYFGYTGIPELAELYRVDKA